MAIGERFMDCSTTGPVMARSIRSWIDFVRLTLMLSRLIASFGVLTEPSIELIDAPLAVEKKRPE